MLRSCQICVHDLFKNINSFKSSFYFFKQICKKLAGQGQGTAEWCTNVGNEYSQILTSVLTCEESVEKLLPITEGLMERYPKERPTRGSTIPKRGVRVARR